MTSFRQPDSLEAQEELLVRYAEEHQLTVVRVYRDSASGRDFDGRADFLRMIADVRAGADFSLILVRDVSRWSRSENLDEAGYYEFLCRSEGVGVLYVAEGLGGDLSPYTALLKSVKRAMAAEFTRERRRQIVAAQIRAVQRGFWPHGSVPYGMRRVLVDECGRHLRDLAPGERKTIAGLRVKMAPGCPDHVAVVRSIFRWYVDEGKSAQDIAERLNHDEVPSPSGGKWWNPVVAHILRNETYTGTLVHFVRGRDSRKDFLNLRDHENDRVIRCPNAHPAIVSPDLWQRAQTALRDRGWRRSDADLLSDLSTHADCWFPSGEHTPFNVTGSELRTGYGVPDDQVVGSAITAALAEIHSSIQQQLPVTELEPRSWCIHNLLRVRFVLSLPHAIDSFLRWKFSVPTEENVDVVLGLGFSPPPGPRHVDTFAFDVRRFKRRGAPQLRCPALDPTKWHGRMKRIATTSAIAPALRELISFRDARAEARLLEVVRSFPDPPTIPALAEALGWSKEATRLVQRALLAKGHLSRALPRAPSRNPQTCACGDTRMLFPRSISKLRDQPYVCPPCLRIIRRREARS